jgi:hypothetical protein
MSTKATTPHLTDAELFGLAVPPAGEPEAVPAHLLECASCGRTLQAWKAAVRELAREDAGPMERRSEKQWREAEDRTLAAIRGTRVRHVNRIAWAAGLAAALLVGVFLIAGRRTASQPARPALTAAATAELSPADQADDALLREASRLARGDSQGAWEPFPSDGADSPSTGDKRL